MKLGLLVAVAVAAAAAPAVGCSGGTTADTASPAPAMSVAPPDPSLPASATRLAPAQTELAGPLTGDVVTETESCAGCHADAAAQWQASAHAYGSFNNPAYRVVVDRFRETVGKDASRFCAGCHDVALLVDGAMTSEVSPEDPRAHGGITCRVCHRIEGARADGNGSYSLDSSPIPIPRDGDDESLLRHKARVAPAPLRTAALCGSCHRSFLSPETGNPAHLVGQDELGAWERSAYAGSLAERIDEPVKEAECRGCHMPREAAPRGDASAKGGTIRSHRFAGANTWLAAMRGDGGQIEAVGAMLRGAASIDVAAATGTDGAWTMPADGASVAPGQAMTLDVVVRNEHVGHRFPGGVLDAQDTWVELEVRDATGRRLGEAGTREEATGEDRTAHRLRALQADGEGTPLLVRETDRFRAPVYNHTIAPRDAEVVRYRFEVPANLDAHLLPLQVTARLRHRSRDLALARATCADASTGRGAAFAREVRLRSLGRFDACAREPVTEIARGDVWLGARWEVRATPPVKPSWRRLYDRGLGLLHAQQEDVDEARVSLERALELVGAGDDGVRAVVLGALAQAAVREGRTRDALAWLDQAARYAPGHPAIAHGRGQALAGVWRWGEATAPLAEAAQATPQDDTLWAHLAVAYGSAGDPRDALDATARGLGLAPRDADMLRVQALALERLSAPADVVARAREAFDRWRPPDDAPAVKNRCASRFPWCSLERLPVHVHDLRPARLR